MAPLSDGGRPAGRLRRASRPLDPLALPSRRVSPRPPPHARPSRPHAGIIHVARTHPVIPLTKAGASPERRRAWKGRRAPSSSGKQTTKPTGVGSNNGRAARRQKLARAAGPYLPLWTRSPPTSARATSCGARKKEGEKEGGIAPPPLRHAARKGQAIRKHRGCLLFP